MLYERWRQIARHHQDEMALADLGSGRRWTFRQLAGETERSEPTGTGISYPQGISPEFVFEVVRAWRAGQVVLPLEADQKKLVMGSLPPGIVHLKTTSATTASAPRVVALTAAQLMADADNIVQTMALRPEWPNVGVISLAHSYGFSNLILPLLLHGIPLVLLDSPLPEALRRSAAFFSDVTLPAVPALWRAWHEAGAISGHIRLAISAGAPLPLALEGEIFAAIGLKLHNFYGATECGGIAYDSSAIPRTEASCAGAPLRNVTLGITEEGCLEVRSPAVAETYWPEPESALGSGCYHTSDLAKLKEGQVLLLGRLGDQINVAGRKVTPESVESALLAHPLVRDCLVFGAPSLDAERSEMIVAGVAARASVEAETLKQFLLARLPAWQVPRDWWFVDSLVSNGRGKLPRAEWRRRYLASRTRLPKDPRLLTSSHPNDL